jgi:hypothetical protein
MTTAHVGRDGLFVTARVLRRIEIPLSDERA